MALPASAYTELLACFASNGRVEQARQLLVRSPSFHPPPPSRRRRFLPLTLSSQSEMEASGTAPLEEHYNAILRGCVAREDLPGAEEVLERWHNDAQNMELIARRRSSLLPSAISYGLVIDAHCSRGDVVACRRLLERMRWFRVPPSTAIFNMQIKAFSRSARPDAAEAVLREMAGSGSWDMEALGIAPNAVSFATVADAWAQQGRFDRVRQLFGYSNSRGVPLDEVSWGTLVKAYARARLPQEAESVLAEAKAAGGVRMGVVAHTQAVSAWCAAEKPAEGLRLLRSMLASGPQPNEITWSALLFSFCALGQLPEAAETLRAFRGWGERAAGGWGAVSSRGKSSWVRGFIEAGLGAEVAERTWERALGSDAVLVAGGEAGEGAAAAQARRMRERDREAVGSTRAAMSRVGKERAVAARSRGEAAAAAFAAQVARRAEEDAETEVLADRSFVPPAAPLLAPRRVVEQQAPSSPLSPLRRILRRAASDGGGGKLRPTSSSLLRVF